MVMHPSSLQWFIKTYVEKPPEKITEYKEIEKIVCDETNVHPELLFTKTRKREVVEARYLCMFFACELLYKKSLRSEALTKAGLRYGKDRTTTLHGCKTIIELYEFNIYFRSMTDKCLSRLNLHPKDVFDKARTYDNQL